MEKIHQNVLKNFKNPTFGPIFHFFQKSGSVTHDFIWVCNTWLTFGKKLTIQLGENFRGNRWTDRPYFIGPFWLTPGVQ